MKKLYAFLSSLFFLGCFLTSHSQNNLLPGDIAFVSYQADLDLTNYQFPPQTSDFEDRFSIMVLKPSGIAGNTVIFFTDNGWSAGTGNFLAVGTEGYVKWVVPAAGLARGTEVYFISTYNTVTDVTTWNAYTSEAGTTLLGTVTTESTAPLALAESGDQILVYQTGAEAGPSAAYNNATRRFITAIHANIVSGVTTFQDWDGPNPTNLGSSSVPPGLSNGTTAFLMSPGPLPGTSNGTTELDNGKFHCTYSPGSCTAVDFSTSIYNVANWDFANVAFPIGATSGNCTFTPPAAPVISAQPAGKTVCASETFTFSSTATGAASYQWQESTTSGFASPVTLTNTGVYSGTTTNTLTITNAVGLSGRYYRLVAVNACGLSTFSNGALLTVTATSLASAGANTSHNINTSTYYYGASCNLITRVTPSGASPVSGSVTSQVWVESTVPSVLGKPYVQRHYDITPATNAATATGTVTLYFTQAEFTAFNAAPGSTLDLPTGPSDNTGKANLRVGKYSGSSNDGTGTPTSYTALKTIIDPSDANIIWNAVTSQWEVTFDVVGFSGFVIQTVLEILPVNLMSFTAQPLSNDIKLKWQTASEVNNDRCELERSTDGIKYTKIASINGANGNSVKTYEWLDAGAVSINSGKIYYRLKMVSITGVAEYSNVIMIPLSRKAVEIVTNVLPNPFKDKISVNLNMPRGGQLSIRIADITGRVYIKEKLTVSQGFSTHDIKGADKLSPGVYFLNAEFEGRKFTYKIVK